MGKQHLLQDSASVAFFLAAQRLRWREASSNPNAIDFQAFSFSFFFIFFYRTKVAGLAMLSFPLSWLMPGSVLWFAVTSVARFHAPTVTLSTCQSAFPALPPILNISSAVASSSCLPSYDHPTQLLTSYILPLCCVLVRTFFSRFCSPLYL